MNEFPQALITAVLGSALTLGALGAVGWLLRTWISARVEGAIGHEYDKRIAEYENKIEMRSRAQLIAELLAEWMDSSPDSPMSAEKRKRLNQLSFEATLWLPERIATDLSKVLQLDPCGTDMFEVLLQVRTHLSGPHSLTTDEVTHWGREWESPNEGLPEGVTQGKR